jgi:hypothetical protein
MLEELYVAVSEARTFANTDNMDTALGYVKNALDSIHLAVSRPPGACDQATTMKLMKRQQAMFAPGVQSKAKSSMRSS